MGMLTDEELRARFTPYVVVHSWDDPAYVIYDALGRRARTKDGRWVDELPLEELPPEWREDVAKVRARLEEATADEDWVEGVVAGFDADYPDGRGYLQIAMYREFIPFPLNARVRITRVSDTPEADDG